MRRLLISLINIWIRFHSTTWIRTTSIVYRSLNTFFYLSNIFWRDKRELHIFAFWSRLCLQTMNVSRLDNKMIFFVNFNCNIAKKNCFFSMRISFVLLMYCARIFFASTISSTIEFSILAKTSLFVRNNKFFCAIN